jgi:hypothetical protein
MAEQSYPFEDSDVTESQFASWASAIGGTGVVTGLAVAPQSAMTVQVPIGAAIVRGVYYNNDAAKNLVVGAAPAAGNTRIDYVVLHLNFTTNTIVAEIKAGTANTSGGSPPALTQTASEWEHPIAKITVASGTATITSGMIQQLLADQGRPFYTWADLAQRPTPTQIVAIGLQRSDKTLWLWAGAAWTQFGHQPAWADITGKPATFPPTTPINANTVNGMLLDHGTSLPAPGTAGRVFLLHA